jgi:hypothetical protein
VVLRRQRADGAGEIDAFAAKADARVIYFTAAASRAASAHARRFDAVPSALNGMEHSHVRADAVPEGQPLQDQVAALILPPAPPASPRA